MRGRSRRRYALIALVGVLTAMLSIVGPALAARRVVKISDLAFAPANVHVAVGDRLTWQNLDPVTHTVHGIRGGFDFSVPAGETRSLTFTAAGTFAYACTIVPAMKGSVIVDAAGNAPAPSGRDASPAAPPPTDTDLTGGGSAGATVPGVWLTLLLAFAALIVVRALAARIAPGSERAPMSLASRLPATAAVRGIFKQRLESLRRHAGPQVSRRERVDAPAAPAGPGVVRITVRGAEQRWSGRASDLGSPVAVPSLLADAVTDSKPSATIHLGLSSTAASLAARQVDDDEVPPRTRLGGSPPA